MNIKSHTFLYIHITVSRLFSFLGISYRAGPRDVVAGEALKAEGLNRATRGGGEYERGVEPPCHWGGSGGGCPGNFSKIYVSENAFQAILSPFFHIL